MDEISMIVKINPNVKEVTSRISYRIKYILMLKYRIKQKFVSLFVMHCYINVLKIRYKISKILSVELPFFKQYKDCFCRTVIF